MTGFRFHAKNLFVTYPQCNDLSKEHVRSFFQDELLCSQYTIGLEQHLDGGNHIHALITWNQVFDTTDQRKFDINGHHPNIQPGRSPKAIDAYVRKQGDYITNRTDLDLQKKRRYQELLECQDAETFWTKVKKDFAQDYVLRLSQLEYMAHKHFKKTITEYVSPYTDFVVTPDIERWLNEEFPKVNRAMGLIYPPMPNGRIDRPGAPVPWVSSNTL